VVATDARGNPDLLAPDAGIMIPVGDVGAMARAMDRILDDPEGALRMAERGRNRMVEQHELSILIAQHEALYRDLLAERHR
jgi:glycosyltransferase involved in cell wall biosynthesis